MAPFVIFCLSPCFLSILFLNSFDFHEKYFCDRICYIIIKFFAKFHQNLFNKFEVIAFVSNWAFFGCSESCLCFLNMPSNNCKQNGSLIWTYFDPFVVHFLVNHYKQLGVRLETCCLNTEGTYHINGVMAYCIKLSVMKLNKSKSPCVSGKNGKFVYLAR